MDIAVVHNFAENPGGGDLVALSIIEALLEGGHAVSLYTSWPEGVHKGALYFGKDLETLRELKIERVEVLRAVWHPYNIYAITKKAFSKLKQHELTIFFDDIPKPAQELKKVLVYVHYPHATRILLNQLVPYRYKNTFKGRIVWKLHSTLFRQFFLTNWGADSIYAIANSTLTHDHVSRALRPKHLTKIYPPVQVKQIINYVKKIGVKKESLAVYIGRIQPEKGIEDIIKAIALLKDRDVNVRILGFGFDNKYLQYLENLAKSLGITKHVEFSVNAPRAEILRSLAKAKLLIHPARYEPFGIAVVEGMATGCIPIVRKGLNGPWIDIVEQGKYGIGFENPKELAQTLNKILLIDDLINTDDIIKRALMFDEETFKERFTTHIKNILG